MKTYRAASLAIISCFAFLHHCEASKLGTTPVDGLRQNTPANHVLTDGRIIVKPGHVIDRGTIVIRNGVVVDVGSNVKVPVDARIWQLKGKTVYPGLIDAFSDETLEKRPPSPIAHWNDRITPERRAVELYKSDPEKNNPFRSQGFVARLVAPDTGIVKGTSVVVATVDSEDDQLVLQADAALHVRLTVRRSFDRTKYPNSPMGAVALARQTMLDADWYTKAWSVARARSELLRPEKNAALDSLVQWRNQNKLVIIDAEDEQYVLRADRFAREFALRCVIKGSGREYRRLKAVAKTGRTLILPIRFPKPPDVGTPESAADTTLEQLMHWDLAPENPARLQDAGISFVLTAHGLESPKDFWPALRRAHRRGLRKEVALAALTTQPAELLGLDQLGTLERGKMASLVVANGDLFDKETKVVATWIRGVRHEVQEEPPVDVRGRWELVLEGESAKTKRWTVRLTGTPTKPEGAIVFSANPDESIKLDNLISRFGQLQLRFETEKQRIVNVSGAVEKEDGQLFWRGLVYYADGKRSTFRARRIANAEQVRQEMGKEKEGQTGQSLVNSQNSSGQVDQDGDTTKEDDTKSPPALFEPNYPLGAYGREVLPPRPAMVLFRGATVWTSGPQGTLEKADILTADGKVVAVGQGIQAPSDVLFISATGKHITPGIIDCHSHMATDGGINESTQAITAEVRIGDFIDANDMTIYRQLAGGVTCANVLHGSANPIGGQNQVIKLRWSALPEDMKFHEAPAGIKFALGENVKQSNWGDKYTTRYPQTRMGVEQIMRDAFHAARHYQQRWQEWERSHQGLPPRRDLELEAIGEILQRKRWIHCHSYRQDEILALLRTLDGFGVQIGTLQHILEGYKVADAMVQHSAMGSSFADWWAYKFEVYDAIPYNGALMHNAGVVVSFNSDDGELGRHLNQEAAKAVKYGHVPADEALQFVTLNPAKQLRIDAYVGSLEPGKHADLVIWSGPPLSNFSRCEQTWIDGRKYFDVAEDQQQRQQNRKRRAALVQKILKSGEDMQTEEEAEENQRDLWPREDTFCGRHGHDHDH